MASSTICDRAFQFALRIIKLCDAIVCRGLGAGCIARQLIRCGTSIGANAEEAQEGQTKADYISKMSLSSKESREAAYWLRLGQASGVLKGDEGLWELREATELRFMLRAAIRTARSSSDRGHAE